MSDAFYSVLGPDRFQATELTRGPWDRGLQHAGPPAALLGRAVERHGDRGDLQVARVTFEIMRPLPIAELRVATRLLRGGRSVELLEATLLAGEAEVMRATALRVRTADLDLPAGLVPGPRLPGPGAGRSMPFFPTGQEVGYHTAMDVRFVAGSFLEPGPATVWMRMRHPLVPGEAPSPLCRVLVAADSGNGVSAALDYRRWRFINPDLTVYLMRLPAGDWVALEAATTATAGVGLADTTLHDEQGPVGRAAQALFIDRR
ncbi:MAG TPA: thioesterase family protein [Actinomycetota bacterium]|nr:thioesterase family protein [Actinomycetota bacterium]